MAEQPSVWIVEYRKKESLASSIWSVLEALDDEQSAKDAAARRSLNSNLLEYRAVEYRRVEEPPCQR